MIAALSVHVCAVAQTAKTAQATLNGKSISLSNSSAAFIAGVGDVTTAYSTFNGATGSLLQNGTTVSGELRPRTSANGIYEGAYVRFTPLTTFDYGSYALTVPTTDSDGDGMLDVFQYDKNGTFTATGSGLSVAVNLTFSITLAFTRSAGSTAGTYIATTLNALGEASTVNGTFALTRVRTGAVTYTRGTSNTMEFTLTAVSGSTTGTGKTTYTTTSSDQLAYAAFNLTDTTGQVFQVKAGTLARTGRQYRGDFNFVDGGNTTTWADFTDNRIVITDANDTNGDGIPDFTDPTALPPAISTQPRTQSATVGQSVTLSVVASGNPTYQWLKNGTAIKDATNSSLTFPSAQVTDSGSYVVSLANAAGTATSAAAVLTVSLAPARPTFTIQPLSVAVARGSTVLLTADASGVPTPTLQWRKDGVNVAGATTRNLVVTPAAPTTAGIYVCVATNSAGTTNSSNATVIISDSTDIGRLVNLSIRTNAGPAEQTLITGFTIGGSGSSGGKPLLVRSSGPSLTQFGVPGVLADPILTIYSGSSVVSQNDDWAGNAQVAAVSTQLGAFAFASNASKDAAIYNASMPPGGYTAQISSGGSTSGIALAEVYDATPIGAFSATTPKLINASARALVGTDANILIAGFVIGGSTAKNLLVRAVGPTLTAFSVPGVLVDPKLELYSGSTLLNSNDDWGGDANVSAAATSVGAFPLSNTTKDAALLVTLPPGSYTAQVSGVGNTTGVALVELYDVPNPPAPPASLSDGLVAYYSFDGNATDRSGTGNNATPSGSYQFVASGLSGSALRINGDSSLFYSGGGHLLLPKFGSNLNAGFTLSLWVKDESLSGQPTNEEAYISFGALNLPEALITLNSVTKVITFNIDSGQPGSAKQILKTVNPTSDYPLWKQLTLTYTPGKMTAYFNGAKIGEVAATFNVFPVATAALGRHWWDSGSSSSARMSATFDNVRIYSRALSDSEVQSLFTAEFAGTF